MRPGEGSDAVTEKAERERIGHEHSREFIRFLRAAGYMSKTLAQKINVHPTMLSHMSTGLRPAPLATRQRIAQITGWPVEKWLNPTP